MESKTILPPNHHILNKLLLLGEFPERLHYIHTLHL